MGKKEEESGGGIMMMVSGRETVVVKLMATEGVIFTLSDAITVY